MLGKARSASNINTHSNETVERSRGRRWFHCARQPYTNWTDAQNTYVYVNYTHSTKQVIIVPYNPKIIIRAIALAAAILGTATASKKTKNKRR